MVTFSAIAGVIILGVACVIAVGGAVVACIICYRKSAQNHNDL